MQILSGTHFTLSNGLRPLPPGPTGGIGTATKGNREGHREVAGATCNFSDFEEFAWNLFFKGVWGQSSLPIWVLGTIEVIWAGWIPPYPYHKIISLQKFVFRAPNIDPKCTPSQNVDLGDPNPILASQIRSGA